MKLIEEIYQKIDENSKNFLGYPLAKDFDYREFAPFLNVCLNNIGDPESPSTLLFNTKSIEKEVVAFFADILSTDMEKAWGYVTNGGTEGNLYGLYLARESFRNPIVYYSEASHYSVKKNLHLLNIDSIVVRSQNNGEIDYEDLEMLLSMNRHRPAIFFLNIGSTMKEAIDDLDKIKQTIRKYSIKDYYIHCDAAFLGCIAPFREPKPKFDFLEGVDSIAISGHKFIGSPLPCGVVLVKRKHRNRIVNSVSYVGTLDTTITGSRNGLTPLFLWKFIQEHGKDGLAKRVKESMEIADYAEKKIKELGINVWRNPQALTIVFDKPSDNICSKYQLASEDNIAHIICVPGITKDQIDAFVAEYKEDLKTVEAYATPVY
ncbi:histidine decarboxylase [Maribacter sp. MMG018]|uniref:histidine decarboxylase n=1 Tax=Maribacter sp. MMG018 TaxID=2822688 RepID=UPI001B35D11A|nr:histidine decarboxylase [Maribacter sp. MMG018]MBQ4914252.1 histidine decarboxylase [Maribacter sp. MMG018]